MAERYKKLLQMIDIFQPQSIVETGTWNGHNAVRMLKAASQYWENPKYIGYDLFEEATEETDKEEFNVKNHNKQEDVAALITKNCPNAQFNLIKGNTRKTLNNVVADFAYIDGGHSLDTIEHDYQKLKGCSVVVFDDYYLADSDGRIPDVSKIGCNKIVEKLPHAVINTNDPVKDGGIVALAVVFGGGE